MVERFEYYSHDYNSVEGSVNLYRRVETGGDVYYPAADYEALEAKLETEKDHSKFLGELLQALYGDKLETLTIHEAKKHKAKLAALVEKNKLDT